MEILNVGGEEIAFAHTGVVRQTLINHPLAEPRQGEKKRRYPSERVPFLRARVGGGLFFGQHADRHSGGKRVSGIRELKAHGVPRKTTLFNGREFSAVAEEELGAIADHLVVPEIPYGALGENLVVAGIDRFTQLPPGSLLYFWSPAGELREAMLAVWRENEPCHIPGQILEERFFPDESGLPQAFQKLRELEVGLRGIVGFVFRDGTIHPGDIVRVQLPSR